MFYIKMNRRSILYTTLLIILLTLVGCNRHNDIDEKLNLADSLMTDKPDSALSVLNNIDVSRLNGRELLEINSVFYSKTNNFREKVVTLQPKRFK